jgi:DNA-binding response OmpR family regulator
MATILCVDGEPPARGLLQSVLLQLGHEPVLAPDMSAALALLERLRVDLVIADCTLADAVGLDLLDELRRRGWKIPVIAVTRTPSIDHAILSMQSGAVDYLVKPLGGETVRRAVTSALHPLAERAWRAPAPVRFDGVDRGAPALRARAS